MLKFLIIALFFSLFSFLKSEEFYLKKDYSLIKPYSGGWETYGTAVMTGDYVRLTHNHQSQVGGITKRYRNVLRDFEVHINFKVHGSDGTLFGDGFAFWYTSKPITPGPIFGSENYYKGLAIFMDTYSNHNGPHHHDHPYISAMVNNGSQNYDHDTDGTHTQLAGCSAHFRNKPHETLIAIRYVNKKLTVSHDIFNEGKWTECFSVDDVQLPLGYYFGLSAATGELADNHDIISMKVYDVEYDHSKEEPIDLYSIEPYAERSEKPRDHIIDDETSSIWTVFKWIFYIILLVCICVGVGIAIYFYKKNEENKKRLY